MPPLQNKNNMRRRGGVSPPANRRQIRAGGYRIRPYGRIISYICSTMFHLKVDICYDAVHLIIGSLREGAPRSGGGECVHIEKYFFTPTWAPSVTASLEARRATSLSEGGLALR